MQISSANGYYLYDAGMSTDLYINKTQDNSPKTDAKTIESEYATSSKPSCPLETNPKSYLGIGNNLNSTC